MKYLVECFRKPNIRNSINTVVALQKGKCFNGISTVVAFQKGKCVIFR